MMVVDFINLILFMQEIMQNLTRLLLKMVLFGLRQKVHIQDIRLKL